MEEEVVKNIRRLSNYVSAAYLQSEDEKFMLFESDYRVFNQQLVNLNKKWFPKAKHINDEIIVERIFHINQKNANDWVKYSLACLINSSQRIYYNVKRYKTLKEDKLFLHEIDLLQEIAFEAAIFMQSAFFLIENKTVDFGHGKRSSINSHETIIASSQLLRKYTAAKTLGDFVFSPTAIFLIRQSIELWLFYIFAIESVVDENGNLVRLQPEKLFKLLDNDAVKASVSKSVIKKIHSWTQLYVHTGRLPYLWEVEHAQHILHPIIFKSETKIDSAYFKKIPDEIRSILKNSKLKIVRRRGSKITLE